MICVPWRSDYGQRERVWRACATRWAAMFPAGSVWLGTWPAQPFNRAAARNAAVAELTGNVPDWDVAVLSDADVMLADADQLHTAVNVARQTGRLVYAHTWQATLGRDATERVLAGEDPATLPRDDAEWEQQTYSGVYAVPRPLWDTLGGFDERFTGWGCEDMAFMLGAKVFGGRVARTTGTVYHLHHDRPREEREGQPYYPANHALFERYQAASKSATAMREVLAR